MGVTMDTLRQPQSCVNARTDCSASCRRFLLIRNLPLFFLLLPRVTEAIQLLDVKCHVEGQLCCCLATAAAQG